MGQPGRTDIHRPLQRDEYPRAVLAGRLCAVARREHVHTAGVVGSDGRFPVIAGPAERQLSDPAEGGGVLAGVGDSCDPRRLGGVECADASFVCRRPGVRITRTPRAFAHRRGLGAGVDSPGDAQNHGRADVRNRRKDRNDTNPPNLRSVSSRAWNDWDCALLRARWPLGIGRAHNRAATAVGADLRGRHLSSEPHRL